MPSKSTKEGSEGGKRTVSDIILDEIIARVDEDGMMPWQNPSLTFNAFNYFTNRVYHGVNRILLPRGEYMTLNQLNEYNRTHGTEYRLQKGLKWYPVVYYNQVDKQISLKKFQEMFPNVTPEDGMGINSGYGFFFVKDGVIYKRDSILQYYRVVERHFIKDADGNYLPSKVETGEVEITTSNAQAVFDAYVKREGINVVVSGDFFSYAPPIDTININPYINPNAGIKDDSEYWSCVFHECGHSTGIEKRLNRKYLKERNAENYAKEEVVAEMTSALLCAECGISGRVTASEYEPDGRVFENNLAYVAHWKKKIKDWGREFIYISSLADKAFNYILGTEDI